MSEKKYVAPVGMLTAAWKAVAAKMKEDIDEGKGSRVDELHVARIAVDAAVQWLSENPVVPTAQQVAELVLVAPFPSSRQEYTATIFCMTEWQRRMFLTPEYDTAIKDLLWESNPFPNIGTKARHDNAVLEAYRRGKEGMETK